MPKKVNMQPEAPAAAEAAGVNMSHAPFSVVEAYKTIRTNLMFVLSQESQKRLVISSAMAGEGKSTTSINVAIAFSQLGNRVLLIDADLRKPTVSKKLKLPNTKGLSSVLVGFSEPSEVVQSIYPNFDVMTSGPIPPNPSELLDSKSMSLLLDTLQEHYDYIMLDTPPINIVSDPLILAAKASGIILVVQDGVTTHDQLKKALHVIEFANVNLLGTILNGSKGKNKKKYQYRYHYYK